MLLGSNGGDAWIGLSDIGTEGLLVFLDGVVSTQSNTGWKPNEPNDGSQNEDCVHINWPTHPHNSVNDRGCNNPAFALCEKLKSLQ